MAIENRPMGMAGIRGPQQVLALGFDLFVNLNWADNALHLALGVVVTGVGFSVGRPRPA